MEHNTDSNPWIGSVGGSNQHIGMSTPRFQFYLYEMDYDLPYSKALYAVLENRKERTLDPDEANVFFTCFSNERHYPTYGNLAPSIGSSRGEAHDVVPDLPYFQRGRHVVFYHTHPPIDDERVINVPYCRINFDASRDIIMCPPALTRSSVETTGDKKYLLGFKGEEGRPEDRATRFHVLTEVRSQDIRNSLIVGRSHPVDYQDLIRNSVFSLVVDGDCHWSYRLTEVINMGSIPVIVVEDDWTNIPFSNAVDYDLFSVRIHKHDIHSLKDLLENMSEQRVATLRGGLEQVNNEVFCTLERQVQTMLRIMPTVCNGWAGA
jgi:hypothetical protein